MLSGMSDSGSRSEIVLKVMRDHDHAGSGMIRVSVAYSTVMHDDTYLKTTFCDVDAEVRSLYTGVLIVL